MKKLITMIASAAMAFGLYADPGFKAGTCFNSWTDTATHTGDENLTWDNISAESTLINPAGWSFGEDAVPARWSNEDPENALNIKSALDAFATVTPTDPIVLGAGEKVYVDTLVKFTAFDQDAEIAGSNAKLAVWIKEEVDEKDEPTGNTKLYITAGAVDGVELAANPVNYECTCDGFAGTDWCRLTIKSMGDVGASTGVRGFAVYINGEPVKCTGISFGTLTLSPLAKYYADNNMLFPSLGDTEISTLAFAGQGAIDDIAFTTEAPSFAADADFFSIAGGEHIASLTIDGKTWNTGDDALSIILDASKNPYTVGLTYVSGYTGPASTSLTAEKDGDYADFGEDQAKEVVAYIGDKGYASFSDAVTAAKPDNTIKLAKAATAADVATAITLDLAGFALSGTLNVAANLVITNSAAGKTNTKWNGQIEALNASANCNINIYNTFVVAGTAFDSYDYENYALMANIGAQIGDSYKPGSEDSVFSIPEGADATHNGDYGYWEVVAIPPTIAIIVKDDGVKTNKYESFAAALAAAVTGDTITLLDNDTTKGFQLNDNGGARVLTIDLGGKTLTFDQDKDGKTTGDGIYMLKGHLLTISNGTLTASYEARDIIRVYGMVENDQSGNNASKLTLVDVALNCGSAKRGLQIEGGAVDILGSTSIDATGKYAIKVGNHANEAYVIGDVVLNTTGAIKGNVLLSGQTGKYIETAIGSGSSIGQYDFGQEANIAYTDANADCFAARIGELGAATGDSGTQDTVLGQLYKTLDAAFAVAADKQVTIIKGVALTANTEWTKTVAFANNAKVTLGEFKLTAANQIAETAFVIPEGKKLDEDTTTESGKYIYSLVEAGPTPVEPGNDKQLEAKTKEAAEEEIKNLAPAPTAEQIEDGIKASDLQLVAVERDGKWFAVAEPAAKWTPDVDAEAEKPIEVTDTQFKATVETKKGFYYGFNECTTVGGTYAPAADFVKGTGEPMTLTAPKKEGATAEFFKLSVSAIPVTVKQGE